MDRYIQVTFPDTRTEQQELLIARLAEAGYEGFEQDETELKAFIPEISYDGLWLSQLADQYRLTYQQDQIAPQNWNEVWESNFQPVILADFVAVRAGFHPPVPGVEYDIVITPKMSFGTGHHATTSMMMMQMRDIDFAGKAVLDFGTGTGILAILAEKRGAAGIIAIDNDEWSIENARENAFNNGCACVQLELRDSPALEGRFDIILANINKNVITANLETLVKQMAPGGVLLISGLLKEDLPDILAGTENAGLRATRQVEKDNWLCISLSSGLTSA